MCREQTCWFHGAVVRAAPPYSDGGCAPLVASTRDRSIFYPQSAPNAVDWGRHMPHGGRAPAAPTASDWRPEKPPTDDALLRQSRAAHMCDTCSPTGPVEKTPLCGSTFTGSGPLLNDNDKLQRRLKLAGMILKHENPCCRSMTGIHHSGSSQFLR